jgi:hypothetical protein
VLFLASRPADRPPSNTSSAPVTELHASSAGSAVNDLPLRVSGQVAAVMVSGANFSSAMVSPPCTPGPSWPARERCFEA